MFWQTVIKALENAHVPYALVGGYAVALHGAVRGTVDIDIIIKISKKHFIALESAMKSIGLTSRLPITAEDVFTYRDEYIQNRNLKAWTFVNFNRPSEIVDCIITHDLSTMKIKKIRTATGTVPVISLEDLIKMKEAAGRPQDIEDVKALRKLL